MADVKPVVPPRAQVPPPPGEVTFNLSASEQFLFDGYAQEFNRIIGTDVELFTLNLKKSKRDALYDEPVQPVFDGPYKVKGYVTYPDNVPQAQEEGKKVDFECEMWIPRRDLDESRIPYPGENDIVRFWKLPFIDKGLATDDEVIPNGGFFFDILNASSDGHMFDQGIFVGLKLHLKRRTEFTPERRILPP